MDWLNWEWKDTCLWKWYNVHLGLPKRKRTKLILHNYRVKLKNVLNNL